MPYGDGTGPWWRLRPRAYHGFGGRCRSGGHRGYYLEVSRNDEITMLKQRLEFVESEARELKERLGRFEK